MNPLEIIAIYEDINEEEFHWIEAEILVRLERYLAFFNYTSDAPFPSSDEEYDSVISEMTHKYNLPRGLWDEFNSDGKLDRTFIIRAEPLIQKWVHGKMNQNEWENLIFMLEADLDTDLPFFLYGIPHENSPEDIDLYLLAESFGKRNRK